MLAERCWLTNQLTGFTPPAQTFGPAQGTFWEQMMRRDFSTLSLVDQSPEEAAVLLNAWCVYPQKIGV